jgi:uncharacterized protein (DUF1015 family)
MPFAGLRYNTEVVGDLAGVVTPPYDVIDADAQKRFYSRHPNNIIRLEYGCVLPDDNAIKNRYTRAGNDFTTWIEEKVLQLEAEPAIYLYEQEYFLEGTVRIRSGFICAVKLESYDKGVVLPHEETIPKHKADRLDLMRICGANFSPVFGLYADEERLVEQLLKQNKEDRPPDVCFTDETGDRHRMWVVIDVSVIEKIRQVMAEKQIIIADGHHRYETALNYQSERDPNGKQENASFNYIMMTLVNLYDPGLVVMPTHRMLRCVESLPIEVLLERLRERFLVEELSFDNTGAELRERLKLLGQQGQLKQGANHAHVFGLYVPDKKFYLLRLKPGKEITKAMLPDKSQAWRNLDVSILQTLVLDQVIGIDQEQVARGEYIAYTREEEDAIAKVDSGEYNMVFFLNPTLVDEIIQITGNGEKMPQKSTFFYPKLISGLVINRF